MEGKKKGKGKDKDKNKDKDKEKTDEEEDFNSVEEELDDQLPKQKDTLDGTEGDAVKTPKEQSAPQTPKGTKGSAPQTPKDTQGSAPQTPKGIQGSAPQTPKGTQGSAPQTPKGTQGSAPQTPKGTQSSALQTPKGTQGSALQTPKGSESLAPQTPKGIENLAPQTPKGTESLSPQTPKGTESLAAQTPKGTESFVPQTPKGSESLAPQTPKGTESLSPQTPKGIESSITHTPKGTESSIPQIPKETEISTSQVSKGTETSKTESLKQTQGEMTSMQKQKVSVGSVTSKGMSKKVSREIEEEPEVLQEEKAVEGSKTSPGIVFSGVGGGVDTSEIKTEEANNGRPGFFTTGNLSAGFPCAPGLLQKISPFIHNPPQPEERRERIPCPRTPREYIINLRENLADFQESHGLPRTRDYSFCSLGLALAQETGRAIFSLFHMFTELFPILAIVSLILRFALDKLIEILETNETGPKIKKSLIFALEMIAIVIPLWILIGTIILPLFGLVVTILKNMLRIKGKKKTVVVRQKPKVQIKASTTYK